MFDVEVKVDGTFIRGTLKKQLVHGFRHNNPQYVLLSELDIGDVASKSSFTAIDLRNMAAELTKVADELDKHNGPQVQVLERGSL